MKMNIYTSTIIPMLKTLAQLEKIMDKGVVHATPKRNGVENILNDRLIFDMFPFVRQIQICCDNAKSAAARLSGIEAPVFEDTEKTPEELKARIHKTIEFVKSVDEAKFENREDEMIEMPHYFGGKKMSGYDYVTSYALPNFYFHATIAYAIMRKNGIDLGKNDFLGELPLK